MKLIILIIVIIAVWGFFIEPNILTVKHLKIKDEQLKGLKIVFASDFHIKPYESYRLQRLIKAINKQNADIVLLGGDYVSGHKKGSSMTIDKIAGEFANIKSKYGTYAVIGNHDGWQGKEEIINELEKHNVKVLFNSNICFEKLCIAGVDDMQTGNPDINKALKNTKDPIILLSHTPDIINDVPYFVNLILAGHLHGGQIRIPDALVVPSKFGKTFANGYYEYKGKRIYTTYGLGTSILPIRLNCPPEIVVINFD